MLRSRPLFTFGSIAIVTPLLFGGTSSAAQIPAIIQPPPAPPSLNQPPATQPTAVRQPTSPLVRPPAQRIAFYYIDFKDVPVRDAVKFVLDSAGASYRLLDGVTGWVSGRLGGGTAEQVLTTLSRARGTGPGRGSLFTWTYQTGASGDVAASANARAAASYVLWPPNRPVTPENVPPAAMEPTTFSAAARKQMRRVGGIARANDRTWHALIVTGDDPATATVQVVKVGDVVKPLASAEGRPPASQRVTTIDATGITLTAEGGTPEVLPLRRADPPVARE